MTTKKFTPPTEFPAEYRTRKGGKVIIYGRTKKGHLVGVIYSHNAFGLDDETQWLWTCDGKAGVSCLHDLQDIPQKHVRWVNAYPDGRTSGIHFKKDDATCWATENCIAHWRIEWSDPAEPEIFVEEVFDND